LLVIIVSLILRPPLSTLFPYTTLFRSMTTVDLADRVWLRQTDDGRITIKVSERFVPNDRKNLAYQAAEILKKRYGVVKGVEITLDRKSTRLNSSHVKISYAVFCLKKKS